MGIGVRSITVFKNKPNIPVKRSVLPMSLSTDAKLARNLPRMEPKPMAV